jgi:hypothetical protein
LQQQLLQQQQEAATEARLHALQLQVLRSGRRRALP